MKKYLPSKKFIKFFGIILGVILVVILVSVFYDNKIEFRNNNSVNDLVANEASNFYTLDSDEDGLYDWEESLWNLNSKDPKSNPLGVADKDYVEAKRQEILLNNGGEDSSDKELNQTDILSRQFLSTAALLRDSGEVDKNSIAIFSKSFEEMFSNAEVRDPFIIKDLKLTNISPTKYKEDLAKAFKPMIDADIDEINLLYRLASGDQKALQDIEKLITIYQNLSNDLFNIETSENLANIHLAMINGVTKLSVVFMSMKNLEDDPVSAMIGYSRYEKYSDELAGALSSLDAYFLQNGII